jgi:uncharacterized protein YuzB (UPF0349 family)
VKLKLCANNPRTVAAAKLVEAAFPRLRLHIAPCLRKCGPCRESLVAVLNGETIRAADGEELVHQLRQLLPK